MRNSAFSHGGLRALAALLSMSFGATAAAMPKIVPPAVQRSRGKGRGSHGRTFDRLFRSTRTNHRKAKDAHVEGLAADKRATRQARNLRLAASGAYGSRPFVEVR